MIQRPSHEKYIKGWGKEIWHFNGDSLCVKTLIIDPKKKCSMHFHVDKEEIFLVQAGYLHVEYTRTSDAKPFAIDIGPGDMILIERLTPHRFSAIGDQPCVFMEFSTHHEDEDSYRVTPGESQA